jgi:hypothetical protein
LNNLKEHAVQTSKLPYYTHGDNDPKTREFLIQSRRTDLFFGWIPGIAASVNCPLQSQYAPADNNPVVPNPLAWAEGAHTYLCAAAMAQNLIIPAQTDHLLDMWKEGMRIRETVRLVTSKTFFQQAGQAYIRLSGLFNLALPETFFEQVSEALRLSWSDPALLPANQSTQSAFPSAATPTPSATSPGPIPTSPAPTPLGPTPPPAQPSDLISFVEAVFADFCKSRNLFVQPKKTVLERDILGGNFPKETKGGIFYRIDYPFNPKTGVVGFANPITDTAWHWIDISFDPDPIALCVAKGYLKWVEAHLVFGDRHPAANQPLPNSMSATKLGDSGLVFISLAHPWSWFPSDILTTPAHLATHDEWVDGIKAQEKLFDDFFNFCFDLIAQADSAVVQSPEFAAHWDNVLQANLSSTMMTQFEDVACRCGLPQG